MKKTKLPKVFNRYQSELNVFTKDFYNNYDDNLYKTHRYFLGWIDEKGHKTDVSGKSFRPSIMMLINESLGGKSENILPLAMSIELFHNFSLIHDDIEDKDEFRRNRKTVWMLWGENVGIISGSSMHALASKSLDKLSFDDSKKNLKLRSLINKTCRSVIEGQYLDISFENMSEIDVENYLEMIEKKTGALIHTSVILGASIEKTNPITFNNLSEIGIIFGHMFQIKDDLLGIWGDSDLGKPIGSDILKKKKSLPILKLIQSANTKDKSKILGVFSKNVISKKDKNEILKLMDKYRIKSFCDSFLNQKFYRSKELILNLAIDKKHKNILLELNSFLQNRTK